MQKTITDTLLYCHFLQNTFSKPTGEKEKDFSETKNFRKLPKEYIMKNIGKIFTLAAVFSASVFTSCHDSIYEMIEKEVALESDGLGGDICQIVQYGDYLVVPNGHIYYKSNQPSTYTGKTRHQWKGLTDTTTDTGENEMPATTFQLASDENNLYALTYIWGENNDGENEPKEVRLYVTADTDFSDGTTWTKVDLSSIVSSSSFTNVKNIFDNKYAEITDDAANKKYIYDFSERTAFIRLYEKTSKTYKLYKLNGTSAPTAASGIEYIDEEKSKGNEITAAYFNGKTYVSKYYAMASDDKNLYYSKTSTSTYSKKYHYVDTESVIYYMNLSGKTDSVKPSAGGILSISPASDYLLIGTTGGLARVPLTGDNKVPSGTTRKFSSNGGSIISEYVFYTFVLDYNKKEDGNSTAGTDEYASSTIYGSIRSSSDSWDDVGLYAYYPSKQEWNRDGK